MIEFDLATMLIIASSILMLLFILSKNRLIGFLAWTSLAVTFGTKIPYFISISDYFNTTVFALAVVFFLLLAYTVLKCKNIQVLVDTTSFSLLAILFYFPFELNPTLKSLLIGNVVDNTIALAKAMKIPAEKIAWNCIMLNDKAVEIILACTGIESMALFAGATLGVRADFKRRIKAFMMSVPVIYILNLFRNVFVLTAYGYAWFGENSFYIAHHVISKFLATLALIIISLLVFRELPELEKLIFNLKSEIEEVLKNA